MAREQRKLAAILAADVVGYSRLMGRDESGTLARLRKNRSERLDPVLARYGGRLVKLTGDGALVEFGSAVDALSASIEFQQAMVEANRDEPADSALVFRIGVHLGDLIVDGDDLYGDGVNVAARLEGEAPAGGILISRNVHDAVDGRVSATFEDMGGLLLKNIERPVQAFSVKWESSDWQGQSTEVTPTATPQLALPLPDKPSIAVLPFQNMSGDPEQEYFVDGLVEDIITALTRFKSLFVIARNSTFTYKNRAVDIKQVGRELGVRYVLEGSVRKGGSRLRITGQVIDATTGGHIWADRYDGALEDLFELQDQITEQVVGVLEPTIQKAEIERVRRKHPEDMAAYDYFLKSAALTDGLTRESFQLMLDGCLKAIALDPSLTPAYALAARAHIQRLVQGWTMDAAKEAAEVIDLVERGLRADRHDSLMLATAGQCFAWFGHDLPKGISYLDEAIAINPNHAHLLMQSGVVRTRAGEPQKAIDHLNRALRLSPRDSRSYAIFQGLSLAHLLVGSPASAYEWAQRAVQHNQSYQPGWYVVAASASALGRNVEARAAASRILAVEPSFSIGRLARRFPLGREANFAMFFGGLRAAGLPD